MKRSITTAEITAAFCRICRLVMKPGGLAEHTTQECHDRIEAQRKAPKKAPGGLHVFGLPKPRPAGVGRERWHRIQTARAAAGRAADGRVRL